MYVKLAGIKVVLLLLSIGITKDVMSDDLTIGKVLLNAKEIFCSPIILPLLHKISLLHMSLKDFYVLYTKSNQIND